MALLSASITPTNLVTTSGAATLTNKTFSDNPTFSGGTVNGVSFLNGSKVLTTGSALTFDGTVLNLTGTSGEFRSTITGGASNTRLGPDGIYGANTNVYLYAPLTKSLVFYANDAEGARLTSTGLGIGTSSPAQTLHVKTSTSATPITLGVLSNATGLPALSFNGAYASTTMAGIYGNGATASSLYYEVPSGQNHYFGIADVTKMTLDLSGNLLVGTTVNSTYPSRGYFVGTATLGGLSVSAPGDGNGYPVYFVDSNATSASQQIVHFDRGPTTVGFITTTNTTTTYSSASDYRLKNTIAPITGALAKVALLKPCTYKWNIDGSDGQGFIAHELQEVCPIAVYGTKDAIDVDGKPDYQGVDTSFLVATLTAAIQEQQAIIESLKARLDAANL